nr:heavy metal-associated isoprenylated plant protein 35-like [Ipomoea trifida]
MASHTAAPADHPEPLKHKMWVLKVSIHCEGCKRKVKKILLQVPGVNDIDIDIRQQRVVVTGDVHADTLIKKLVKSGKNAELWPQMVAPREGIPAAAAAAVKKAKELKPESKQEDSCTSGHGGGQREAKPPGKVAVVIQEPPAKKTEGGSEEPASGGGGVAKEEGNSVAGGGVAGAGDSTAKSVENLQGAKESKSEGKKPETGGESSSQTPATAEKKDGEAGGNAAGEDRNGGGAENGSTGKTKKKKGQNGNSSEKISSSAGGPAGTGSQHHETAPHAASAFTNQITPHHPYYGPTPVYAVSYNTAYPTSSSTTSYYAAPPSNSYAYTYPGPTMEPPPSDLVHPQQPLDSFELFSDENPNGCSVM